jgi:hypothetical protein
MKEGIEVGKWNAEDGEKKETQTAQPKSNHRLSLSDARFYR